MATGRVWVRSIENPTHEKNVVRLNLTPEPEPAGEIWHPNPSGFVNGFLSGFSGSFQVLSFFGFFRVCFRFWVFPVSGAPAGAK
jgi:hypothetical protein